MGRFQAQWGHSKNAFCYSVVYHPKGQFEKTKAEAALAAGIFHREEVPIEAVKDHMREKGIETRWILTVSVHIEKGPSL
jgi:hypothetical protein